MPNPYKFTGDELDDLVEDWHTDDRVEVTLKEYIMWYTRFNEMEAEYWLRTGALPSA